MSSKPFYFLLILILFSLKSIAQLPDTKQQIVEKLNTYFGLERENIHLHLNKNTYFSDESIWFKGYVYNRKELLPFYSTMNVFVVLYNQSGIKIDQQLAYSNTGTFDGAFKNLTDLPSGNYYIQVYTHWMNNFQENESTLFPIKIINSDKPNFFDTTKTNVETAKIEIHPEGGTLLYGISNSVGVKTSDLFNNPIGNLTAELRNQAGVVLTEIAINNEGSGKFTFVPKNETYYLSVNTNNKTIEQKLPRTAIEGISIEVNNYALTNKTSVKIKTNANTFEEIKSKKLFMLIHQDQRALVFDVTIDSNSLEQTLLFSTENMSLGVNTIRILDEKMNLWAERIIMKLPPNSKEITLSKQVNDNGYLKLNGLSSQNDAHLSISLLPKNSKALENNTSILSTLLCNSYLLDPISNFEKYSTETNLAKKYELDLALLNQSKSKYAWNEIVQNPPTAQYEFDMGLTVKGKLVSPNLRNRKEHNIRLRSYHHQILIQSPISETDEFEFKHLLLHDSTTVDIGLFKNIETTPIKLNYNARITNGNRTFKYDFKGINTAYLEQPANTEIDDFPGFYENTVQLNSVDITVNTNTLKRSHNLENMNLRGYKVPETMTINVLTYIETNGFNVSQNGTDVSITVRGRSSINAAQASPIVYLDNVQIREFSFLQNIQMDELDEIYMNPHAIVPSMRNLQGIIRMYRKELKFSAPKTNLKNLTLNNGYAKAPIFKNSSYSSASSQGFINYGIINWIPSVLTDEKNTFQVDVPNYNQDSIKVCIEGFTYDGRLISETQMIEY